MQTSDEELAERLTSRVCVDPNGAIKWYDSRDVFTAYTALQSYTQMALRCGTEMDCLTVMAALR